MRYCEINITMTVYMTILDNIKSGIKPRSYERSIIVQRFASSHLLLLDIT